MRGHQNKDQNRVGKKDSARKTSVQQSKGEGLPSKGELSVQETQNLYSELEENVEVHVAGLFRASGERSAVAAVTTIVGFVALVLKHVPLEVCLIEGALGAWLVWMMAPKKHEKD